jgi:metal-responsive CopG/Arc/MetJ family transcriptional regulator
MKTTVVLDDSLVEKIDQAAKNLGINRSIFIRFALKHELEKLGLIASSMKMEIR